VSGVGRNDPCPCGSGKKFKRCCLTAGAPAPVAYTRDERAAAWAALGRFASRNEFAGVLAAADHAFFGTLPPDLPPDVRRQLLSESRPFLEEWLLSDHLLPEGDTLLERFLAREGRRLRSGEIRYLERVRHAHLRPYEVAGVVPGERLDLLDLWTGQRLQVRERLATSQLVRWDVLAARVILGEAGVPVIEGSPYLYPVEVKEPLLKEVRRAHRRFKRAIPEISAEAFFKRMGRTFFVFWLEHVALRPPPAILSAEGDELVLARVVFDVQDPASLEAALASHPDLERDDEDGSYAWTEDTGDFRRGLGTFIPKGGRLVFETMSRPRAERGRALIEGLAGPAVAHRATTLEGIARAAARVPASPPVEVPPEIQAQIVGQFLDQHYRKWPDEPLPGLDGKTPREAAQIKTARPKLVSLLKSMENMAERDRRAGRPGYDFGWLWDELGLVGPE